MNKSDRGKRASTNGKSNAVINKKALAMIGVYLLPVLGALALINGIDRLSDTVWMYITGTYDRVHAARELCVAIVWLLLPVLCLGYFLDCRKILRHHQPPE